MIAIFCCFTWQNYRHCCSAVRLSNIRCAHIGFILLFGLTLLFHFCYIDIFIRKKIEAYVFHSVWFIFDFVWFLCVFFYPFRSHTSLLSFISPKTINVVLFLVLHGNLFVIVFFQLLL